MTQKKNTQAGLKSASSQIVEFLFSVSMG